MIDLVVCFWSWIDFGGGWLFIAALLLWFVAAVVGLYVVAFLVFASGWLLCVVFRWVCRCWFGALPGGLVVCLLLLD